MQSDANELRDIIARLETLQARRPELGIGIGNLRFKLAEMERRDA